jgi:phosphohistidine phosphatase
MRRLLLLRHAKSARPKGVADIDRPLSARGLRAAPLVGAYMVGERLVPDLSLVSPARRAQETWRLARQHVGGVSEREEARIYEATADRLLAVIVETDPLLRVLLIVGHNPGLEDLAIGLVGAGDRDGRERLRQGYPTAALAVIDFDADDWRQPLARSGRLERFVTPRSLNIEED